MSLKKHILILIITVLLSSCGGSKTIGIDTNREVKRDSITTIKTEIKRDTIRIPGDTLKVIIPVANLTSKPIIETSTTGRTKAAISKQGNNLHVECFTEDYEKIIERQKIVINTLIRQLESLNTTETVEVTRTPWYMKALAFVGLLAVSIIGVKFFK